jgi:hypothetical protein
MGDQDIHRRFIPRLKPATAAAVPDAVPLGQALDRCEPLMRLQQRLAEAHAHLDAVRPVLPPALLKQVRSGPTDGEGWTLLASNPAVAAKLRQLLPRLEAALRQKGCSARQIKVRVQVPEHTRA